MICSKIFLLLLSDYLGFYHMPYFERKDSVSTMSLKSNLDAIVIIQLAKVVTNDKLPARCSTKLILGCDSAKTH